MDINRKKPHRILCGSPITMKFELLKGRAFLLASPNMERTVPSSREYTLEFSNSTLQGWNNVTVTNETESNFLGQDRFSSQNFITPHISVKLNYPQLLFLFPPLNDRFELFFLRHGGELFI